MKSPTEFQLINHPGDGQWHIERNGVTVGYAFPRREGGWGAGLFAVEDGPGRSLQTKRAVLDWAKRSMEARPT